MKFTVGNFQDSPDKNASREGHFEALKCSYVLWLGKQRYKAPDCSQR